MSKRLFILLGVIGIFGCTSIPANLPEQVQYQCFYQENNQQFPFLVTLNSRRFNEPKSIEMFNRFVAQVHVESVVNHKNSNVQKVIFKIMTLFAVQAGTAVSYHNTAEQEIFVGEKSLHLSSKEFPMKLDCALTDKPLPSASPKN